MAWLSYGADGARALVANHADFESVFIAIVAVPSIVSQDRFVPWLLLSGGRHESHQENIAEKTNWV